MSSRARVLAGIRASLGDVPASEDTAALYPAPDRHAVADAVELFVERVEEYRGRVRRSVATGIAQTVGELFAGSENELLYAPGIEGGWLPEGVPAVADTGFAATELDAFGGVLTGCCLAIAETGTIVLDGGPRSGRRAISLVPDLHICVVHTDQIVASVPEAIDRLRDPVQERRAPLTFVSGPSATSDIEFQRVEGVHGPRRLEVVLVSREV